MKKFIAFAFIITISLLALVGCAPDAEGGKVLDNGFKIVAEQMTPASGTPNEYTPEQNLAYAAYKFNRASSWETMYEGEVVAVGTNQKVRNKRQFDNGILFAQAISVSGIKTVGEQKYFKGDDILYRPQTKIDKNTLQATWSNYVTTLSREDYFKNYGIIPNEIFKYYIDQTTILSSERIESENFAYRFVLSTDAAKYLKNEVRTLAGAKSDPEFLSIECTIEMDESWNIIKTTAKEIYKVAIMGGVKCESNSTEVFTVGQPVNITDKAIFEAFVPGTGDEPIQPPKQPIDYLTLAFTNLAEEGKIKLLAQIGSLDATVNMNVDTGLFTVKIGSTAIKNTGDTIYIIGDQKVKIDSLTMYEAIYFAVKSLPLQGLGELSLPLNAPEISALLDEVVNMLAPEENADEPPISEDESDETSQPKESMISRILDGMDMEENDNTATISMKFTLDGIDFDIAIAVKDERLASLTASLTYEGKTFNISLAPTNEEITVDESGAHDISSLIRAASEAIQRGVISLGNNDLLITATIDGVIKINSDNIKAKYKDKIAYLETMGKRLSADLSLMKFDMPNLGISDILTTISQLRNLPFDCMVGAEDNKLTFDINIDKMSVLLALSLKDDRLFVELKAGDVVLTSTDREAEFDDNAEFVKIDNLLTLVKEGMANGEIDISLVPSVGFDVPEIDLTLDLKGKKLIAAMGDIKLLVSDALYVAGDGVKGKFSFDSLSTLTSLLPAGGFDSTPLLTALSKSRIYNSGDELVIEYYENYNNFDLNVKAIIGESAIVTGTLTLNGKTYSIIAGGGHKLTFMPTEGFISLDPIAYFVYDAMINPKAFNANFMLGDKDFAAALMPDIKNGGIIAKVGNSNFYAYDKLYFENLTGKYCLSYNSINNAVSALGFGANFDIETFIFDLLSGNLAEITASRNENILTLDVKGSSFKATIEFDYVTDYLYKAEITTEKVTFTLSPADLELTTPIFDDFTPIDYLAEVVSPIKETLGSKALTFTLSDFNLNNGALKLFGDVSIDRGEQFKLDLDLTFVKNASHNIKATLRGDEVKAVYNDTLKLNLDKNSLLTLLFDLFDIVKLNVPELEKYRPSDTHMENTIIYEALPQDFKDTISRINELIIKGFDIADLNVDDILYYIDNAAIGGQSGKVTLKLPGGENGISVAIGYGDLISTVEFASDNALGTISISDEFNSVILPSGKTELELNSLTDFVRKTVNTVELGKYNVSGNINLSIEALDYSIKNVSIGFELKSVILPGNKPLVYLYLDVPRTTFLFELVGKANSYIFFYEGMMYLKSERYRHQILQGDIYDRTLYLKQTPAQFVENIFDNLMFLVPMADDLQGYIKDRIAKSEMKLDFTNAFTAYSYSNNVFDLKIDLQALTGNQNLGNLDLKLSSDDTKINKFDIGMKLISIIDLSVSATLNDYDGNISYGKETDIMSSNLFELPGVIQDLKNSHAEWQ